MLETKIKLKNIEKSEDGQVAFLKFEMNDEMEFQEGQFVMLESIDYKRDEKVIRRAYSIASTNNQLKEKNEIDFIVKKASEDGLSFYLTQKIEVGHEVKLIGPAGHFFDDGKYSKYLFVSIGSGVAPMYAKYLKLKYSQNFDKIANLFGERFHDSVLPHLEETFSENNEKIRNFLYLSRCDDLPENYKKGYVQDSLDEALEFLEDDDFVAFLCGKPAMVEFVEAKLLEKGLSKEQIKFEKY